MNAVRWAAIAMLCALILTAIGIALAQSYRGGIVPSIVLLFGGFSLIASRAASAY